MDGSGHDETDSQLSGISADGQFRIENEDSRQEMIWDEDRMALSQNAGVTAANLEIAPDVPLDYAVDMDVEGLKTSIWTAARHELDYFRSPTNALLCREAEHAQLKDTLKTLLLPFGPAKTILGGVVFVAGVPGTGKTATARLVVQEMQLALNAQSDTRPSTWGLTKRNDYFLFVEVNAFKLSHPRMIYPHIWWMLNGIIDEAESRGAKQDKFSADAGKHLLGIMSAQAKLDALFRGQLDEEQRWSNRKPLVLLLDELELLLTKDQQILYTIFEWARMPTAKLVIIGISNMLDLAERVHQKINSRLGSNRLLFHPYQPVQLQEILIDKMKPYMQLFEDESVLGYIAKKVGASKGDARLTFEVCSRSIRYAEQQSIAVYQNQLALDDETSPSEDENAMDLDFDVLLASIKEDNPAPKNAKPNNVLFAPDFSVPTLVKVSVKIVDKVFFSMRDNARVSALHGTSTHERIWILAVLFEIGSRRAWRAQVSDAQRKLISKDNLLKLEDDVTFFDASFDRYEQFARDVTITPRSPTLIRQCAQRIMQIGVFTWNGARDRSPQCAIYLKLDPEEIFSVLSTDAHLSPIISAHQMKQMYDLR